MTKILLLLSSFVLACAMSGCSSPGVVQVGQDTYLLSRSSAAGAFTNIAALQSGVIRDANTFASKEGKVVIPLTSNLSQPPVGFPSFDFRFMAVTPDEATRIAAMQSKQKAEQIQAWNSLTPAQRIEYTLRLRELQDAEYQSQLNRQSYDERTQALQQPANVNVNVNGTINHNVNGTIGVYGY